MYEFARKRGSRDKKPRKKRRPIPKKTKKYFKGLAATGALAGAAWLTANHDKIGNRIKTIAKKRREKSKQAFEQKAKRTNDTISEIKTSRPPGNFVLPGNFVSKAIKEIDAQRGGPPSITVNRRRGKRKTKGQLADDIF
jgi:hypothetical protein